jgi:SAM-dependent methyltransferase
VASGSQRERLRETFDEVAELYDRSRPGYPDAVFDDLVGAALLGPGSRVVEIGPGTGQATRPLAERELEVTAVELGSRLAAVARRNLAGFPAVQVVEADVETWTPQRAGFDAVAAFTAFHWLDPATRYSTAAALLRPLGALGVVGTRHVGPDGGDPFFAEVQEDYIAVTDVTDPSPPPHPDEVPGLGTEIEASGLFRLVASRRYAWDVTYTAEEYVAVLDTYSGHRMWPPDVREQLYDRIRARLARRADGLVRKSYLATLDVAEKL